MHIQHHPYRSDIDIDIYFDSLGLETPMAESSDPEFEFEFEFEESACINLPLKKGDEKGDDGAEEFRLPPLFERVDDDLGVKKPLSKDALERIASEMKLLYQQLENTPSEFMERSPIAKPSNWKWNRGTVRKFRQGSTRLLALLLGVGCFYGVSQTVSLEDLKLDPAHLWNASYVATPSTPLASAMPQTSTTPAAPEPFREAVNWAMKAAELTQTAHTAEEWDTVTQAWLDAIRLMDSVPHSHARYEVAVHKVEEYARNLAYAQRQMRTAKAIGDISLLPTQASSPVENTRVQTSR